MIIAPKSCVNQSWIFYFYLFIFFKYVIISLAETGRKWGECKCDFPVGGCGWCWSKCGIPVFFFFFFLNVFQVQYLCTWREMESAPWAWRCSTCLLQCWEFCFLFFPLTNKLVTRERCLFTANSDPSLLTAAASNKSIQLNDKICISK